MTNHEKNNDDQLPDYRSQQIYARNEGWSKCLKVVTTFLIATSIAALGTSITNLLSQKPSLSIGINILFLISGILTTMLACGIQFLDPMNGAKK